MGTLTLKREKGQGFPPRNYQQAQTAWPAWAPLCFPSPHSAGQLLCPRQLGLTQERSCGGRSQAGGRQEKRERQKKGGESEGLMIPETVSCTIRDRQTDRQCRQPQRGNRAPALTAGVLGTDGPGDPGPFPSGDQNPQLPFLFQPPQCNHHPLSPPNPEQALPSPPRPLEVPLSGQARSMAPRRVFFLCLQEENPQDGQRAGRGPLCGAGLPSSPPPPNPDYHA